MYDRSNVCAGRLPVVNFGKTTLLLALQARGYTIVGDSARTIIQDRRQARAESATECG